ncbi:MAG: beta-lactamase family protein [Actinomycetota bacterium]|nr:beta-lactamase family protein [Actinomycetota bacterium]
MADVRRWAAVLAVATVAATGCTGSDDAAGAKDAATSTTAPAVLLSDEADFAAVAATMDAFVAEHALNGAGLVIVDRDEGIVDEHYVGEEFGPDHLSLIASSSKMITAGVLMRLHDQGVLDVDAPVAEAVDWPGSDANPDVTPAQLISNSSGLVGLLPDPTYSPYLCQYLIAGTLTECGQRIFTTTDDDADIVEPDTEFRYGGGQWQVAGAVAEAASGRSWAELVDETYVQPCGVRSLAYNNHFAQPVSTGGPFGYPAGFGGDPATLRPTDNPNMEGGAYVSPRDYAALLRMHLRGGMCDGERVLSEASVARMHTDRVVQAYDAELGPSADSDEDAQVAEGDPGASTDFRYGGYGLGWWIGDGDSEDVIEDAGAYGAVPWIDLDRGYAAYLIVEASSSTGRELAREIRPIIASEIDAVRGAAGTAPAGEASGNRG